MLDLLLSAVRSSLLNARLPQLVTMKEYRPIEVERTIRLLEKPRLRTSLRLALVLLHYSLAFVAAVWLPAVLNWPLELWNAALLAVGAALLTLLLEMTLEGLLLPEAEEWAMRLAGLGRGLDLLLSPLSAIYVRLLGANDLLQQRLNPVTEAELKNWVEAEQPAGSLEQGERRMIYSIFHFGDTLCREIMVPRIDITALDVRATLEEAGQVFNRHGHSRVPVYEETVDNVIGLLYAKDLLTIRLTGQDIDINSVRSLLRPAYFVPEAKKVDELLREMQLRSIHMAIIVDEYGGVAGLVTLEDIVEEIVGDIRDEYDQSEEQWFSEVQPGEYIFQGRIDLDDFNEVSGGHLTKDLADTLGGFIYSELGHVPAEGESVQVEGLELIVEQVSGRRIRSVRARRLEPRPAMDWTPEEKNDLD